MGMDIKRALDMTSGAALIPQQLDPMLRELADQETPLRVLLRRLPWSSDTYRWKVRSALGTSRFYVGSDVFADTRGTYAERTAIVRQLENEGSVDNLLIATSKDYINALTAEIEGATKSLAQYEEQQIIIGSTAANAKAFNGLSIQCTVTQDAAHAVIGFNQLDTAVQTIREAGGKANLIVVSYRDQTKLNQLARAQGTFNMNTVDVGHGNILQTYLNIPIIGSAFVPTNLAPTGYTNESYAFILDTSEVVIPVVKDMSYEDVPNTLDAKAFRVKLWETLAVTAVEKQIKLINISAT